MIYRKVVMPTKLLSLGFIGICCSFEHRLFKDRTPEAQEAYLKLKDSLIKFGMKDPLITHRGNVLIGMRRFEILASTQKSFRCIEILEDVALWRKPDIIRLSDLKKELYGDSLEEFLG